MRSFKTLSVRLDSYQYAFLKKRKIQISPLFRRLLNDFIKNEVEKTKKIM